MQYLNLNCKFLSVTCLTNSRFKWLRRRNLKFLFLWSERTSWTWLCFTTKGTPYFTYKLSTDNHLALGCKINLVEINIMNTCYERIDPLRFVPNQKWARRRIVIWTTRVRIPSWYSDFYWLTSTVVTLQRHTTTTSLPMLSGREDLTDQKTWFRVDSTTVLS